MKRHFLAADYSIECDGEEYAELLGLTWPLVFIWPVGIPLLFFVLLMVGYRDSLSQATPMSRSIRFLHAEYRHELFYWE